MVKYIGTLIEIVWSTEEEKTIMLHLYTHNTNHKHLSENTSNLFIYFIWSENNRAAATFADDSSSVPVLSTFADDSSSVRSDVSIISKVIILHHRVHSPIAAATFQYFPRIKLVTCQAMRTLLSIFYPFLFSHQLGFR